MKAITGSEKFYFGKLKSTGERVFMSKPSFDCGWYWSFGYLGNKNCHYHLSGYQTIDRAFKDQDGKFFSIREKRNICMHDALLADYDLSEKVKANLWVFCEMALSIYTLNEAAGLFKRGGSHMTTNPSKDVLQSEVMQNSINEVMLPSTLQKFWNTFA